MPHPARKPETQKLATIVDWIAERGLLFSYSSFRLSPWIPQEFEDGIRITITQDFYLSVQTHPALTGSHFAETALIGRTLPFPFEVAYVLDYSRDVLRWDSPEALFYHVMAMKRKLAGSVVSESVLHLADGTRHEIRHMPLVS